MDKSNVYISSNTLFGHVFRVRLRFPAVNTDRYLSTLVNKTIK